MQPIDLRTARELIDFSGGDKRLKPLGELQLRGAVALTNMIADPSIGVGYLADEVGMGKTYVALGVVALMRYFNPSLRVLYILPSGNVQDKWAEREHPNFINTNVIAHDFRIRTPDGRSGTPSISCPNIESLINAATTGYYGDMFVRMSSFSLGMGSEENQLKHTFSRLKRHVPTSLLADISPNQLNSDNGKALVKEAYATVLNYLLPTFDLVIIDEAHNFKHDFDSSARNLALSRILGLNRDKSAYRRRVKNALLLSATPYDREPRQLYNQLRLVGKERLMPDASLWGNREQVKQSLQRFMVRRLNELDIQGAAHTRNMYRREWRSGHRAEIGFETDEHKLITALVQKHVGDVLDQDRGIPSFQMGMLASFESYAQTSGIAHREFDGDEDIHNKNEARDRHAIDGLRHSYVENDLGQSLPHPKMDQTARMLAEQAFERARKQLVFVRRVRSVNELKEKLDDLYNAWLIAHIRRALIGNRPALALMDTVVDTYHANRKRRDDNTAGVETEFVDDEGESLPPKNDTLFSWFFRGEQPEQINESLSARERQWPTPAQVRRSLTAKDSPNALLFEFNWVDWFARYFTSVPTDDLINSIDDADIEQVLADEPGVATTNRSSAYLVSQIIVLRTLRERYAKHSVWLDALIAYLNDATARGNTPAVGTAGEVRSLAAQTTFFTQLAARNCEPAFFATAVCLASALNKHQQIDIQRRIHKLEIHRQLLAQTVRSGHSVVDLYLSRLALGAGDLDDLRRGQWLDSFLDLLVSQPLETPAGEQSATPFSTAVELNRLSENIDLIIKNNLPRAYDIEAKELRRQLNYELPPGAPIAGANGETTSNRSSQARKFRMPGYPLVLVSTDVFQEGEDLHTFCDSVVHYGLSGSPVSIEQKTGRVDRVGAFAHRRLLAANSDTVLTDGDYIQVSFPFVKQSIEAIQVRQLCRNLNDFIRSLHKVGENDAVIEDQINVERQLMDRGEIPGQIFERLSSPYDPPVNETFADTLFNRVHTQKVNARKAFDHVKALMKSVREKLRSREEEDFTARISSARACGEMLLNVATRQPIESDLLSRWTAQAIRERQVALYESSFARTYARCEDNRLALYQDSEILIGGSDITCEQDILGAFDRLTAGNCRGQATPHLPSIELADISEYAQALFGQEVSVSRSSEGSDVAFIVVFNDDRARRHRVTVEAVDHFTKFESTVASHHEVANLKPEKLLACSWLQNHKIDLVELIVAPTGCLVGRTFHPTGSLSLEEFAFNLLVLAVESDRVEHQLHEPDEY